MKKKLITLLLALTCACGMAGMTACSISNYAAAPVNSGIIKDSLVESEDSSSIENPAEPTEELSYALSEDGSYYIVEGIGTVADTNIVIPETYNNLPVKEIGWGAFVGCSSLISVTIPDSVSTIGEGAFADCYSLTSVTIPDSVTSIGDGAFSWCYSLTSVTIGDSVTTIGEDAFEYCRKLTSVTIGNSVTTIGEHAFYGCDKLFEVINKSSLTITAGSEDNGYVAYYAKQVITDEADSNIINQDGYLFYNDNESYSLLGYTGTETELVLPNDINGNEYVIYQYAFYFCSSITSVTIGDSVTTIGDSAFYYCSSLTSVTIGDSVTSIGWGAFYSCSSLTSVTIGDSVTSIGNYAFSGCTALTEIHFNATEMNDLYDYNNVFSNAGKNGEGIAVTIGANVTKIPAYLFYLDSSSSYAPKLTSVVFEENSVCTNIGEYAFRGCSSLTSVTIGDSVTSIGNSAFLGCGLTSITIPDSVTTIGSYAFYGCRSLTSVTIGNSVKTIGAYAFSSCDSLTSVTIPDSVTTIGGSAFLECSSLTSVTIGDSVTGIGYNAFMYCSGLTSVTFENPDGWTVSDYDTPKTLSAGDLANTETAATYLRNTYGYYTWTRF